MLNTEYRLYDPRLAQWLTRDPVFQPWESPYSAMGGNPILFSDPQGLTKGTWSKGDDGIPIFTPNPGFEAVVRPTPDALSYSSDVQIMDKGTIYNDKWSYAYFNGYHVYYLNQKGGTEDKFFYLNEEGGYRAFTPMTERERIRWRLRHIDEVHDDLHTGVGIALTAPLAIIAAAEIGVAGIATIGLRLTNFALRNPATIETVGEIGLTAGLAATGVETPPTPITPISTNVKKVAEKAIELGTKQHICLGVNEILETFSKNRGSTYHVWGADNFPIQFIDKITDPNVIIHFNLDGIADVWAAISSGAKGFGKKDVKVTSWELYSIYSRPEVFSRTIFYQTNKDTGQLEISNFFNK